MCYGHKYWGTKKLAVGVLVLLNAFVWPQWLGIDGWVTFFGVLLILGGLVMLVLPKDCCGGSCEAPKKKK